MTLCYFVSDLHGKIDRYKKLFDEIKKKKPKIVFIGGDLLPNELIHNKDYEDFTKDYLIKNFLRLKKELSNNYPEIFLILGNDDLRNKEILFINAEKLGLWKYIHNKKVKYKQYQIYGYSYVPPTPFLLKDWERYDVSRFVDPGCIPPTEGYISIPESYDKMNYSTIQEDLEKLTNKDDLSCSIFLFHAPPYKTNLDRAALDGKTIDYVPMDVHVGSIAIKRFIEEKQPFITLHGHIHESSRITGYWKQQIKNTYTFSAAYDKPQLAIIKFDIEKPFLASRYLI